MGKDKCFIPNKNIDTINLDLPTGKRFYSTSAQGVGSVNSTDLLSSLSNGRGRHVNMSYYSLSGLNPNPLIPSSSLRTKLINNYNSRYIKYYSDISLKRMYSNKSKPIGFTSENLKFSYFSYDSIMDYKIFRDKLVYIIRPGNKYAFLLKIKRDDGC